MHGAGGKTERWEDRSGFVLCRFNLLTSLNLEGPLFSRHGRFSSSLTTTSTVSVF
jgi:hypothetical protein